MCQITATELKNNLGYYMELSSQEDIYVTKNNKVITVLTNSERHRLQLIDEISGSFGKVDENVDYDEILRKAITEKCTF